MSRKGRCEHFTGVQHNICKAGIRYDSFENGRVIPCIDVSSSLRPDAPTPHTCDKFLAPTSDQIAARESEIKAHVDRFKKATPLISRIKKEQMGGNWSGVEVCPVCNGRLHMSHAAYNGHVWGKCETKGCLSWIE